MLKYNFDECLKNEKIAFSTKLHSKVLNTEHSHDFYELTFPIENSFYHCLNGNKREMSKYDLCLITPNDTHHTELASDTIPNYFTISVKASHFKKITDAISSSYLKNISQIHYAKINPQIFEQCKRYLYSTLFLSPSETEKKQLLISLAVIKLITEFQIASNLSNSIKNLVDEAIEIMQAPENMRLSIKEIAIMLGYSQEHLIRSFKKQGQSTPNKVFSKIKLEYSVELLCATDYTITEICDTVGFFSVHYFNSKFKEAYGISPTKYRKKYAKLF